MKTGRRFRLRLGAVPLLAVLMLLTATYLLYISAGNPGTPPTVPPGTTVTTDSQPQGDPSEEIIDDEDVPMAQSPFSELPMILMSAAFVLVVLSGSIVIPIFLRQSAEKQR